MKFGLVLAIALFALTAQAQVDCSTVNSQNPTIVFVDSLYEVCPKADGGDVEVEATDLDGNTFIQTHVGVSRDVGISGDFTQVCGGGTARARHVNHPGGTSAWSDVTNATFRPCRPFLVPGS